MLKLMLIAGLAAVAQLTTCNKKEKSKPCDASLQNGLIAWYPLNGDAKDYSGNNKHGQLMNGTGFSSDNRGRADSAAQFDGSDDYILIKDASNYFAPPKLSVSFLVNLRDVSARSSLFCKSAFNAPTGLTWGCFITNKLVFRVTEPNVNCDALWYDNSDYDLYSTNQFKNNRWYAVTLIFNEGVELMYIDGKLNTARVNTFSGLKQCSSADLRIGGWWKNDIISIHGKLDNIRFYNRILSETEIEALAREVQ